jgi:Cu/Ag efflux protein CusF
MVSIRKVLGVLSCGCLLSLGLSTAIQAGEKPPVAEKMNPGFSVEREGDRIKPDEDTVQGINTIKGEVLRIKGEHVYVRQSDGKEMHLHTKPTTRMTAEFKKGDRIEAKVNDQNDALSIRQVK